MTILRTLAFASLFNLLSVGISAAIVDGPVIQMDPNGVTPLAAEVRFSTDVPVRASIEVTGPSDSWSVDFDDYLTEHAIPILGMKPNGAYSITVTTTDKNTGEEVVLEPVLQAITGPLPNDFPIIDVRVSQPQSMEPGYTLLDKIGRGSGDPDGTYTIILDQHGDVVWYSTEGSSAMRRLTNGHLFFRDVDTAREMDLLGNYINTTTLDMRNLHHDLFPTGDGRYFSIGRGRATVDDYPTSVTDPDAPTQSAIIADTPAVEFNNDGSVRNIWPLAAILDPKRITYSALNTRPDGTYDWAHANAITDDPNDDTVLISVRHQDVVAKFSRVTGELKWLLGPHANWGPEFQSVLLEPVGAPFEWQFHQHAQMYTPNGNLLLHDNGNYRASPFDGSAPLDDELNYTRAVEYEIDEDAMTVRQVWQYGGSSSERIYSSSRGDADWMLETGNVLIVMSDVNFVDGVASPDLGFGRRHARIIEVNHSTPAEKVFEVALYNPDPERSVAVYRSERIPSLYASPDADADGIRDRADNCVNLANPLQRDADHDGIGNDCQCGDMDGDGLLSSNDATLIKNHLLGLPSPFNPDLCDVNNSGSCSNTDAVIIQRAVLGLPPGISQTCAATKPAALPFAPLGC